MAAEVYYVDLLALLRQFKNNGIPNSILYGRIVRQMDYPPVLQPGVVLDENGIFVEMEVFAINIGKYTTMLRESGVYNKDEIFMVNGSVLTYIDKRIHSGVDWYQITGTLRRQSRNNAASNCVAMFNFYRPTSGTWGLKPCAITDLDIAEWDRHAPPYAWINASADANAIKQPPEVLRLPRFATVDQTTTSTPRVQQQQPQQPIVPANIGSVAPIRFNKENRQTLKQCGEMRDNFAKTLVDADKRKKEFVDSMLKDYKEGTCSDSYISYMLNGILSYFNKKPHQYAFTGRGLVKKYFDTSSLAHETYLGTKTAGAYLADNFREVAQYILHGAAINADGVALDLCKSMCGNREAFYAGISGVVLGLSQDTVDDIVQFCTNHGLSITKILNENPYMLQFFSSLSFDEIERIAMCFGKHEDSSLSKYRNTAMLNAYISDTSEGSTIFKLSQIQRANIGVRMTRTRFQKIKQGYTYLTDAVAININSYIRDTTRVPMTYNPSGFRMVSGGNYVRSLSQSEVDVAVRDYIEAGLGVVRDDYITSSDLMKKELFVFDTMRQIASKTYNYKTEDIDRCIAEYEHLEGFKLEASQVKAVHLLTNAAFVVAGSAGSGKTTVSKCVVYTLRKLSPMLEIRFAAPTGKAAKRMQEVVQEECRTLHSMFRLSTSADTMFNPSTDDCLVSDDETAYFFDESAMVTVDLLYRVLRHVNIDNTRVFLFGDFNQLSPIGKGLPFKNLLRFMPCVFLDVVKRASEGSNITANSAIVNDHSDMGKWEWLRNGKDFFLLSCGSEKIQGVVYRLCAHYLGKQRDDGSLASALGLDKLPDVPGLTPDDIQVVSPLTKSTYHWGATVLNQMLQPLFNSERAFDKTFIYQVTRVSEPSKFMIGDRVIHTDKNMYSMQWYGSYHGGVFQKIYGQGICNGEVGKIVDIQPADGAKFINEKEPMPDEFEYTEALRMDPSWGGPNAYFVVVEYYDFIQNRNFYILYRAELNTSITSNEGIVLKGEDIQKLNLFYAGTTHKLQGSQAKIIIFALDDVNFGGFITRQMVYTMMTRAEKLCFGVGSVSNTKGSMLSRARMDIASLDTLTVGELLV